MINKITDIPEKEYLLAGTRLCAGCSLSLAYKIVLKALGKNTIITIPAGCSTLLQGLYPVSSVDVTILNTAFATTASSAAGICASLKAQKKDKKFTVVGWAGDGGTADIGIQALSAAAERNENFIYICCDNEAYMNTGTQRSGSTPRGALTTTTPGGKKKYKKNMPKIMAAHNIPYIATACPAYPVDLYNKIIKAKSINGLRYIHIFTPCPPGWGFNPDKIIKIGKAAVESGIFDLYEIENNTLSYSGITKKIFENKQKLKPVKDYLKSQKRFIHLTDKQILNIQTEIKQLHSSSL